MSKRFLRYSSDTHLSLSRQRSLNKCQIRKLSKLKHWKH